jgi:hypothetical protein
MNVGVTGHRDLSPATRPRVAARVAECLAAVGGDGLGDGLTGVTSLAGGADQLFAFSVLAAGGRLEVVIPFAGYRDTLSERDRPHYDRLLALAGRVVELPFDAPCTAGYLAAGRLVVDRSELLLAVWDGQPAAGEGGTAEIVAYARETGTRVEVVWPEGSSRDGGP